MKTYRFLRNILLVLAIVTFASCSDDDNTGAMSRKLLLNQELVASNYSFIWNGVTSPRKDDVKAKFEAVEGDTTKMKMTISGIIPSSSDDIQLVVDVLPLSDEIQYQGKVESQDYNMTVSGVYFPSKSDVGHYFKLKVVYDVANANFLDKSYRFNFKKGCTAIPRANSGDFTIDDVVSSKASVAENVLSGMTNLYAKTDSVVEFNFAKDGTLSLDILNTVKGESVTTNWMTPKYWFASDSQMLVLEFTKEQATAFVTKFLNKSGDNILSLFSAYGDTDKYILKARYYTMNGKLSLELVSPYLENAMSVFATGRGTELDASLQKQVNALATELQESPSHWQIQFVSE